jgi:hypothetical protein
VVSVADYKHRGPGLISGHCLGFFWGSWVWNGVHLASWSDKLSSYLNKEVTVRLGKLKMQLWDSMCWPHVNPVPSGAVRKDCQRRLLSWPRLVRAVAPRIYLFIPIFACRDWGNPRKTSIKIAGGRCRGLNPGHSEYEALVLATRPRRSVPAPCSRLQWIQHEHWRSEREARSK